MAQRLRDLAAITEDMNLVPKSGSSHHLSLQLWESDAFLWL